jgi:hypothetical protein
MVLSESSVHLAAGRVLLVDRASEYLNARKTLGRNSVEEEAACDAFVMEYKACRAKSSAPHTAVEPLSCDI